jgi:DNA polymerase-3 subunit epsilon
MNIKRALIVDCETSGVTDDSEIVELGLILYSVTSQTAIAQMSMLFPAAVNHAAQINRIPQCALDELRTEVPIEDLAVQYRHVQLLCSLADCFVAHNAEFDQRFFHPRAFSAESRPWLCTMTDFRWPNGTKRSDSLINLALAHGIGVSQAHRALTDCMLIAALFDRMDDLPAMFEFAMRPKFLYQALVEFKDNHKAKDEGFTWKGERKAWVRKMLAEEAEQLPFPTRLIDSAQASFAAMK